LWHAEHAVLLVYALGILLVAMNWMRRGAADIRYPRMWMAAALAIYCGLVVGSNALHRFVVYDRLARQMLPFVCLAAAAGLMRLTRTPVLYGIIILLFAANVAPLLAQRFPRDMVSEAIRRYGLENVRLEASLLHLDNATAEAFLPPEIRAPLTASARAKRYVLLNAVDIWPKGGELEEGAFPAGRQLLVARHPRQLRLLQYHGYTPVERRFLRSTDFSMRLIDTEAF
jgi:hypothetical protein